MKLWFELMAAVCLACGLVQAVTLAPASGRGSQNRFGRHFSKVAANLEELGSTRRTQDLVKPGFEPTEVVRRIHQAKEGFAGPRDDGEFLIDTSARYGPPPGSSSEEEPAIAFDGTNFLVTWRDYRNGSDWDIYGARVTADGTLLDRGSIRISCAAGDQTSPAVASDGTDFLVTWTDLGSSSPELYGTRVTPGGVVLDPSGILISTEGGQSALAFGGTNFLVTWYELRSGSGHDIYGARVTPGGMVLDPSGIPISTAAGDQEAPALAFDGTNFLVTWQDRRSYPNLDIYGARVTPAGAVLDSSGIPISTAAGDQEAPALAFDGTCFLVTWQDDRDSSYDIYGARVTSRGTVLDTSGIPISNSTGDPYDAAIALDGTNFLVTWEDSRGGTWGIYGARVSPDGTVLDTAGIAVSASAGDQWISALAYDGTNVLAVWEDDRTRRSDIYGARVTPEGTVLDTSDIAISAAASSQYGPALAFDGANFLVTWMESRSGPGSSIRGARATSAGSVLDTSSIPISTGAYWQCNPAVAFDGTDFLVAWEQPYRVGSGVDICGARVTPGGTVLDTSGIPISVAAENQGHPALAFDGTNFLVTWEDARNGSWDIYGARVTPEGTVLDTTGIPISTGASDLYSPALAFDGTNFLVTWTDHSSSGTSISGTRVTPGGTVLDTTGILISSAAYERFYTALAYDGADFFVTWEDWRSGPPQIYGARVTPGGAVLDTAGIQISNAADDQVLPAIAFDGANYLVTWTDWRSDLSRDIYGARVTTDGTVFDSGSVVRQEGGQSIAKLCRGNGSQMLLTYQGWAATVGGEAYNSQRIWGKMNPNVGVAENKQPTAHSRQPMATILRGVLQMPLTADRLPLTASLLDISGRKVMELKPGPSDVSRLAPGVYFVREEPSAAGRQSSAIRKVILTR